MDTINTARNSTRFISTPEEVISWFLSGATGHTALNEWTELRQESKPQFRKRSRMEEVDQKDAVAGQRLGTLRDEQQECGKDGRAELLLAEREQPRLGRPGPSAVASLERNWTLDQ